MNHKEFLERMNIHTVTVAQAKERIPLIKPILSELVEKYKLFDERSIHLLKVSKGNHEVAKISQVKYETDLLEEELEELRQKLVMLDCVVKDWRTGLVDFVYESGETIVWLCFQHGEDELQFYHYWDAGFRGRRKIDFE